MIFVIGLPINIRIVLLCWKSRKDNQTWQLHIVYSMSCTIFFAFIIPFSLLSHTIPHLSRYTGEGICYFSSFTILFNTWIIHINSLLVAVVKYILIVHWNNALLFGHAKIQWIMFSFSFLIPLYLAVVSTWLKEFGFFDILHSCFGSENTPRGFILLKTLVIANKEYFGGYFDDDIFGYTALVVLKILAVFNIITSLLISTNICEAFFYYKTFKRMKR